MAGRHRFPRERRPGRRVAIAATAGVAALALTLGGSAAASAKGGGAGGSIGSATIVPVPRGSSDDMAHFGGQVTFTISQSTTTTPMVKLDCYQGATHVYWASAGFFDAYPWPWARDFTLRSDYWVGGGASCVATLYYPTGNRRYPTLATTTFDVLP